MLRGGGTTCTLDLQTLVLEADAKTSVLVFPQLAANLAPTHFSSSSSSSQPQILSMTAKWHGRTQLSSIKSNSSLTWEAQKCSSTYSFVALVTALIWAICGRTLPVFSSNTIFFSSHPSVLIGGPLYTWPAINGAGSTRQNTSSGHFLWTQAAEDACHPVSRALDDEPNGKTHPRQKKHVTSHNHSLLFGWSFLSILGFNFHCKTLWSMVVGVNHLVQGFRNFSTIPYSSMYRSI